MPKHLGPDPFEQITDGRLAGTYKHGMICVYPSLDIVVSGSGTHGDCHGRLVSSAEELGLDPSLASEWLKDYVAAVVRDGNVLIRDDGHPMPHVFHAAELLEEVFYDQADRIRYLGITDERVRDAVRGKGQLWRINPPAQTTEEMEKYIRSSRVQIGSEVVYYYDPHSGTRYLTEQAVESLFELDEERHRACAEEIAAYAGKQNKCGIPQVVGFNTPVALDGSLQSIRAAFETRADPSVGAEFSASWIVPMYRALSGAAEGEEEFLGLCPELKMKIRWLPGACLDDGLRFHRLASERVRGIINNLVSVLPNSKYINVGCVIETRSLRRVSGGRREVYVIELEINETTEVYILRMQDWDTWHYLEGARGHEDPTLEEAEAYADEYARYKFLCGNFAKALGVKKQDTMPQRLKECYTGTNNRHQGRLISAQYSLRRYVYGMATDKVPEAQLKNRDFCLAMATLLGEGAAANMIIGRANPQKEVLFNDGDEYFIIKDAMPIELRVGDVTGCLSDYESSFEEMRPQYEQRLEALLKLDPLYRKTFVDSFISRYDETRSKYLSNPKLYTRHLDFQVSEEVVSWKLSLQEDPGSFRFRARRILERLERTTPDELRRIWS